MNNEPAVRGLYPHYSALWHLESIGVMDNKSGTSQLWDRLLAESNTDEKTPTRVALIDNSVAWMHPNLKEAIDTDLMIDFFSAPLGAFPAFNESELSSEDRLRVHSKWAALDAAGETANRVGSHTQHLFKAITERLFDPSPVQQSIKAATHPPFSAHGTAMAGLIGARPAEVNSVMPAIIGSMDEYYAHTLRKTVDVLPYAGVDPFCKIIPISTSFDPDPDQLLLALLYADLIDADLIVLARDFPDPRKGSQPRELEGLELQRWEQLEALVREVSERRLILCAAGNGADDSLIYPASLADGTNGMVAVGARTADGTVAGYSPENLVAGIFLPSGDSERLDREVQRLDTLKVGFDVTNHSRSYVDRLGTNATSYPSASIFSLQDLISTDVPGQFGYNGSNYLQEDTFDITDFGSYYCRFSGTSGAVAVAAGLVSLAYFDEVLPRKSVTRGNDAREILVAAMGSKNLESSSTTTGEGSQSVLTWDALKAIQKRTLT